MAQEAYLECLNIAATGFVCRLVGFGVYWRYGSIRIEMLLPGICELLRSAVHVWRVR